MCLKIPNATKFTLQYLQYLDDRHIYRHKKWLMTQFYSKVSSKTSLLAQNFLRNQKQKVFSASLSQGCCSQAAKRPQSKAAAKFGERKDSRCLLQHSRKYKLVYCPRSRDGLVQGHFQLSGTRRPVKGGNGHCMVVSSQRLSQAYTVPCD